MTEHAVVVINDPHPLKEQHIGWQAERSPLNRDEIVLYEVVARYYRHPEAPDDATISVTELVRRHTCKTGSPEAGPIMMLLHLQTTLNHSADWKHAPPRAY